MTHSDDDVIHTFEMGHNARFGMHHHNAHQLIWPREGIMQAQTTTQAWTLSPSQALWIPPYVDHDVITSRNAVLRTVYLHHRQVALRGDVAVAIEVDELIRAVIDQLADGVLDAAERTHLEIVLLDRLRRPCHDPIALPIALPRDDRARRVALALQTDPADQRSLSDWGRLVGASARTLSRLFRSETGLTFEQWRRTCRMHTAHGLLKAGTAVERCATQVGYAGASAFGVAYRTTFGHTPTTTRNGN